MVANPTFHKLYPTIPLRIPANVKDDHVFRIALFMDTVTSVEQTVQMCSEAIDDLIRESPLDDKNSINIVCEGFRRLHDMTHNFQDRRGRDSSLLVKCIANLHILLARSYTYKGKSIRITKYLLLNNLLGLFLAIVESPDGQKELKKKGLMEAIAGLPKELQSHKNIIAISARMTRPNATSGHRRSKKHGRSKKTKTCRSRK